MKISKEEFDAALVALDAWKQPEMLHISPSVYCMLLEEAAPNRHMLYSAGWRAGYTVNGLKPQDAAA